MFVVMFFMLRNVKEEHVRVLFYVQLIRGRAVKSVLKIGVLLEDARRINETG